MGRQIWSLSGVDFLCNPYGFYHPLVVTIAGHTPALCRLTTLADLSPRAAIHADDHPVR